MNQEHRHRWAKAWARSRKGKPTANHVLLALVGYVNEASNTCTVKASTLSSDTGLVLRTVKTALKDLAEAGAFERIHRPYKSSVFWFKFQSPDNSAGGEVGGAVAALVQDVHPPQCSYCTQNQEGI